MMANLAAIDEFGHFGSQQPVAAIGAGGRRQIALELHGRVILGSSLTLRRLCQLQRQAGEAVPTQNSESQRNHGVSLTFRVLSRDRGAGLSDAALRAAGNGIREHGRRTTLAGVDLLDAVVSSSGHSIVAAVGAGEMG